VAGITANREHCRRMVENSIGIVTALNPVLGYETSCRIAKQALQSERSVYDLILEEKLMNKDELDRALSIENMIHQNVSPTGAYLGLSHAVII
jgi:aspartate ammonia-lyase